MATPTYSDILLTIRGKVGTITLNRPASLNAFNGSLMTNLIAALRHLDAHPTTVATVITGSGRFFSAGADVRASGLTDSATFANDAEKKLAFLGRFTPQIEMMRSLIDHRKLLVLAMNGPAVGGGAAWFQGVCDIFLAAEGAWMQVPFSALGLVPENGSATLFAQAVGTRRANEFLMFGRRVEARELETWGLVNKVFPNEGFADEVGRYLEGILAANDGKSLMEAKRLQNLPLRGSRMLAVVNAIEALAERFVADAPKKAFEIKKAELEAKSKGRAKL